MPLSPVLSPFPVFRAFDSTGAPLVGGFLYTYQAGTTTPANTYTDETGATKNANPVVLDATGSANVWYSGNYKLQLTDSAGNIQWTVDNVSAANNAVAEQVFNVLTYGAVGDGVTDDTAALQLAINAAGAYSGAVGSVTGSTLYAPGGYVFKTTTTLYINSPISVDFRSIINFTGVTGTCLSIGQVAGNYSYYDMKFLGFTNSTGNTATPGAVNNVGTTGVAVYKMAASKLEITRISGFTKYGINLDGASDNFANQLITGCEVIVRQIDLCGSAWVTQSGVTLGSMVGNRFNNSYLLNNFNGLLVDITNTFTENNIFSFSDIVCPVAGTAFSCAGSSNLFLFGSLSGLINIAGSNNLINYASANGTVTITGANNNIPSYLVTQGPVVAGYLNWLTTASLKFAPFNGSVVKIAGQLYQIPNAGITIANAGINIASIVGGVLTLTAGSTLAASTAYYLGLQVVTGTITPVFYPVSAFGHAPDTTAGNVGMEVLTNLGTGAVFTAATLIGLVATDSSGYMQNMLTASWFNPRPKIATTTLPSSVNNTSATWIELSTNLRIYFVTFGSRAPTFVINGSCATGNATESVHNAIGLDGVATLLGYVGITLGNYQEVPCAVTARNPVSEGLHFFTLAAKTQNGYLVAYSPFTPASYPLNIQLQLVIDG